MLDKLLDMMSKWPPIGQGFFLLVVFLVMIGTINYMVQCFVALFRGWPTKCNKCGSKFEEGADE